MMKFQSRDKLTYRFATKTTYYLTYATIAHLKTESTSESNQDFAESSYFEYFCIRVTMY